MGNFNKIKPVGRTLKFFVIYGIVLFSPFSLTQASLVFASVRKL
jgi:hypothetical protein